MPDVFPIPDGLKRILTSGEFVLFAGAGVGVEAGIPNWSDALIALSDLLRPHHELYSQLMKAEAQEGRFLQAAELLYIAPLSTTDRSRLLTTVFGSAPSITRRLKLFALTRCQGIVTTNFDRSLDLALSEAGSNAARFGESDKDLAAARIAEPPYLVRMHGRIEVPESLILAAQHYREVEQRQVYVEFFRELLVNRNLVVFGFSFRDPIITDLISRMSLATRSLFRRDAYALVPEGTQSELVEQLREAHITAVSYPVADNHAAAWNLLESYRVGPPAVSPEVHEAEKVKSHLAAAYARAKSRDFSTDKERIMSALMQPLLAEAGTNTVISIDDFLGRVESRLALPKAASRQHLTEALKMLERDGAIAIQGDSLLVGDCPASDPLAADAERLVSGVMNRARLRLGTAVSEATKPAIRDIVIMILALDGLHLAHSLIKANPLDRRRLEGNLTDAIARVKIDGTPSSVISEAVLDLFWHPDPEEEQLLTNISAVVFTTAILLADPILADRLKAPFEVGAYIDASVVLPWLATGHPLHAAYEALLNTISTAKVSVMSGYLNELVSHRALAVEAVEQGGLDDPHRFRRYASFYELHNINVFLGGYAGLLERGFEGSFKEYLSIHAPFESEEGAARFISKRGLRVDPYTLKDAGLRGELKGALKDIHRYRDDVVVGHDAAQLEALQRVKDEGVRPFFVTADRSLIAATMKTSMQATVRNILLPQQVAYLAQMEARPVAGFSAFARTLWSVTGTVADHIKRYYTDRVLKEYDAALISQVPHILATIMKDLRSEGLDVDTDMPRGGEGESKRLKVFERLDRFEPRFYENMAEAKAKLDRQES